jgi:hypothetical protein
MRKIASSLRLAGTLAVSLFAAPALAANALTFIDPASGDDGDDGATLLTPVKTLASALAKTNPGGEIFCVRPGSVGSATVTRGVSIHSPEGLCKIQGPGVGSPPSQLVVNTPSGEATYLDRLFIDGGFNTRGITVRRGDFFGVDFSVQNTGPNTALVVNPTTGQVKVTLVDARFSNNGTNVIGGGVLVRPTGSGSVDLTISDSTFHDNARGVSIDLNSTTGGADVSIDNTILSGSPVSAVFGANTTGGLLNLSVINNVIAHNATGIVLSGAQTRLNAARNTFASNAVARNFINSAVGLSTGDNIFSSNGSNGTPFIGTTVQQ